MIVYGIWTFAAAVLAFIISAVTGKYLIPYLHKINFGQTIREEGPQWHKGKQGTPIMGGIMFILASVVVGIVSTVLYALFGAQFVTTFFADIHGEVIYIFAKGCKKAQSRPYSRTEAFAPVCGSRRLSRCFGIFGLRNKHLYSVCRQC